MVATQRQVVNTSSRCTPGIARGTHSFEIIGYSLHKGIGRGNYICSDTFSVGGYEWCIRYYPDGYKEDKEYVSAFVELISNDGEVRVLSDLSLVKEDSGLPLRDDRLVIKCEITVIEEPRVRQTSSVFEALVPPSDLSDNLGKLLEAQDEADVVFKLKGEAFPAHKIILAMRSPVFKAQFYGPMSDKSMPNIEIEDIQPAIFKALLHFIYTDSLPSMDGLDDVDKKW